MLKLATNLSLPDDAVTQTFAILAKRGVGKTHTGGVMAEEMLKLGQPIVAYDPTGAWWGLKSSRSGKAAGYPVVVFGGEHADVPLHEDAGDMIATVIVEKRLPAILDCSLLRKAARIRFMTAFCETLFHKNREALHFFVDEAQMIAPQNLKAMPEAARLLGAMEDIVMQGRRKGLGLTIISPRPAVVNTNLRSACEVVIAMQIIGPHDRKAIQEWIDLHGDDAARGKEMMAGISALKRGEAWIWSPGWLEIFQRVHIRQRETFDSSATPEVGGKVLTPTKVAAVDLVKLGAEIQATLAEAKANDPKSLRARIAELERDKSHAASAATAFTIDEAEVNRRVGDAVELAISMRDQQWAALVRPVDELSDRIAALPQLVASLRLGPPVPTRPVAKAPASKNALVATPREPQRPSHVPQPRAAIAVDGDPSVGELSRMERAFLTALAMKPAGRSKQDLLVFTGYTACGAVSKTFAKFNELGWWAKAGDAFVLTSPGNEVLGRWGSLPEGEQLRADRLAAAPVMERRFLEAIFEAYPGTIRKKDLLEATGYTACGAVSKEFARLNRLKWVTSVRGELRASDVFFEKR